MKTIAALKKADATINVVLQVKGNQKKLLVACQKLVHTTTPTEVHTTTGKCEHGRIEKRMTTLFAKDTPVLGAVWDDSIPTVIMVERTVRTFNTTEKKYRTSTEIAFYISTNNTFSAAEFAHIIRSHWSIENTNHYVRDVTLHEDFSRVRRKPENIATLRSFALNLLRINGETNVSQALYRNAVNVRKVLQYKGIREE